jgi:hypothetical protein
MPGLALQDAACCITVSHVLYFRSEIGAQVVSHQVEHACISHGDEPKPLIFNNSGDIL